MAQLPKYLSRAENVTLSRRDLELWVRRVVLLIFLGLVTAGLANVFGQKHSSTAATASSATLVLDAPAAVRTGLIYQAKFEILAVRALRRPALVLAPGWFDGLTINSIDPEPIEWAQRGGRNVISFGPVPAGSTLDVRLQYQVNPTSIGRRDQDVALEDGGARLVTLSHRITIYP